MAEAAWKEFDQGHMRRLVQRIDGWIETMSRNVVKKKWIIVVHCPIEVKGPSLSWRYELKSILVVRNTWMDGLVSYFL